MGGSVLFEGCPDDDMDLAWRGRVEFIAVDVVLPETSVKLGTKDEDISLQLHLYNRVCIMHYKIRQKNGLAKTREHREGGFKPAVNSERACVYLLSLPLGIAE